MKEEQFFVRFFHALEGNKVVNFDDETLAVAFLKHVVEIPYIDTGDVLKVEDELSYPSNTIIKEGDEMGEVIKVVGVPE